ncbi:MAG TPA: hypothetical protein VLT15_10035 [Acidimicrobiia bacterium]|nr:hypothetical protein [Acidimicrobiia bacterium]
MKSRSLLLLGGILAAALVLAFRARQTTPPAVPSGTWTPSNQ